jgi:hypothetical protein
MAGVGDLVAFMRDGDGINPPLEGVIGLDRKIDGLAKMAVFKIPKANCPIVGTGDCQGFGVVDRNGPYGAGVAAGLDDELGRLRGRRVLRNGW